MLPHSDDHVVSLFIEGLQIVVSARLSRGLRDPNVSQVNNLDGCCVLSFLDR